MAPPGVTGLSGSFDLDQAHGSANFDSRDLKLDAPKLWNEQLMFSSLGGDITWDKRGGPWRVAVDNVRFAGSPLTGSANGTWTAKANGPGVLDLRVTVASAAVSDVMRFTPLPVRSIEQLRNSPRGAWIVAWRRRSQDAVSTR